MKTRVAVNIVGKPIDIYIMSEQEYRTMDNASEGICLECGYIQSSCEPDARRYECEECEMPKVCGASEALIMGRIEIG